MRQRVVGLTAAVAALAAVVWLARPAPTRPNVLLVTIDTLRADRLGSYGYAAAATPVLDGLAARGVRFATAVAHAPLTAPSHASILTGLLPLGHGVRDNGTFVLPPSPTTLAEVFRASGYRTAAFVSGFPLDHRFGFARGFESYDDHLLRGGDGRRASYVERPAAVTTREAAGWVRAAQAPWFAWVHYFDPHSPYEPPADLAARFAANPYDGEIASVDRELGHLLAATEAGRASTLVLVTSDHGESLGEHGEATHGVFVYDSTLRVPWIMAGPGVAGRPGRPRSWPAASTSRRRFSTTRVSGRRAGCRVARSDRRRTGARWTTRPRTPSRSSASSISAGPRSTPGGPRGGSSSTRPGPSSTTSRLTRPRPATSRLIVETRRRALRSGLRHALEIRPLEASTAPSDDARERLRALGYVGGTAAAHPTGRDPKDGIALVERLERGLAEARARPAVAVEELTAFLAAEPDAPLARRYRAIAFQYAGRYAEAVGDIRALEARRPLSLEDLTVLAESLRLAGRLTRRSAALDRAAAADPRTPEPALLRGRTLRAMGRSEEAGAAFRQALALEPGNAEARRGWPSWRSSAGPSTKRRRSWRRTSPPIRRTRPPS